MKIGIRVPKQIKKKLDDRKAAKSDDVYLALTDLEPSQVDAWIDKELRKTGTTQKDLIKILARAVLYINSK